MKSGVSPATLHKIETGKTQSPHIGILQKIADALGVKVQDLGIDDSSALSAQRQSLDGLLWELAFYVHGVDPKTSYKGFKALVLLPREVFTRQAESMIAIIEAVNGKPFDEISLEAQSADAPS